MHRIPILLAAWLALHSGAVHGRPLQVAVSIPPQKYLVERIGGARVEVRVMLAPGRAPETFEPTPRQMAALAGSDIYFRIGVPFEEAWLASLQAGNPGMITVDCCLQFAGSGHDHGYRGGRDPHVWVSPTAALSIAQLMQKELARLDPEGAGIYAEGMRRLALDLHALHVEIMDMLGSRRTSHFVISHDSLGQFAAAYGLVQHALESGGKAAGPKSIARIMDVARAEGIRSVIVQREFNSAAARTLAAELGAGVIEIDPLSGDFINGMRRLASHVAVAMEAR